MDTPIIREVTAKSILSKSNLPVGDYSVNPYVGCTHACKYCYACFMKRFTNHPEPWGDFLDVKYWPEIKNPKRYAGKELFLGSVTDPYNPQEAVYGRTRALLVQLLDSGAKISITTKSDLVLRDLELIRSFPDARVAWSINTLDEGFRQDMDRAVSIERRLAAMETFHNAGVRTTCFISPIFPGSSVVEAIIECAKPHCYLIWLENLNLRGSFLSVDKTYIRQKYTTQKTLFTVIYDHGDRGYWQALDAQLKALADKLGLDYVTNDDSLCRPFDAPPVIVNYFYHSEIKRSARKRNTTNA